MPDIDSYIIFSIMIKENVSAFFCPLGACLEVVDALTELNYRFLLMLPGPRSLMSISVGAFFAWGNLKDCAFF